MTSMSDSLREVAALIEGLGELGDEVTYVAINHGSTFIQTDDRATADPIADALGCATGEHIGTTWWRTSPDRRIEVGAPDRSRCSCGCNHEATS